MKKILVTLFVLVFFVFLGCSKNNLSTLENSDTYTKNMIYYGGVTPDDPDELAKTPRYVSMRSKSAAAAALPASVDMTEKMPPVGRQKHGDCTAWAVAYAAKTFQEGIEEAWDITIDTHIYSPSWLFNQIVGNRTDCYGSGVNSAINVIVNKGIDTLVGFPYDSEGCSAQPDANSFARAAQYKAAENQYLGRGSLQTTQNIKEILANGNVVIFAVNGFQDLVDLDESNPIFNDTSNQLNWSHAMVIVGYDDSKQAFKFINSWGTSWGLDGYGWMSYNLTSNDSAGFYAYVMIDGNNDGSETCIEYTDTNYEHVQEGRAYAGGVANLYAYAAGSDAELGLIGTQYYSTTSTLSKTAPGYYIEGNCPDVDNEKPVVSIASLSEGDTVSGVVTVNANATDNVGVTGVTIGLLPGLFFCTDTMAPYSCEWDTTTLANGTYTLTARAVDAAGNEGFAPAIVVTVNNVVDTQDPSVAITSPANDTTVNGTIALTSNSSDNIGIVKVVYTMMVTGQVLCESTTAPFSCDFDTTTLANGDYSITARADDAAGNEGFSTPVHFIVNNPDCEEFTSTNVAHISAGRAEAYIYYFMSYAKTIGSGESLGLNNSFTITTVKETAPGYFEKGNCE